MDERRTIAYFSMEVGLEPGMRTYAGGLGVLAGDSIRSAADMRLPLIAVTLLYRRGYFQQSIDERGEQHERPAEWPVEEFVKELSPRVTVRLEGRDVLVRAWERRVRGCDRNGRSNENRAGEVPVLFLDTDLAENAAADRELTHSLYGGDLRYRLCQEVVLGVGGVRMLRALGHEGIRRFHLNEGHAALATAELLREEMEASGKRTVDAELVESVRRKCSFTTHTPVPAGHDSFDADLVREVVGRREALEQSGLFEHQGRLNMTYAALNLSNYVNGVARRHGEVSREMFGEHPIDSITNGVHLATWAAPSFHELFDRRIPGWRSDNASLRFAMHLDVEEIAEAHERAKHSLIAFVNEESPIEMSTAAFTIGCARRATAYKRLDLILSQPERMSAIADRLGPIQIVFAGKAHPRDTDGKKIIRRIHEASQHLRNGVRIVFLPGYDMEIGRLITSGCDVWLNTPRPPMEASGTSGMKAAVNGVPSLSVLDGWWLEGCIEGITGWGIRGAPTPEGDRADADELHEKLEGTILPLFYGDRRGWYTIARQAIALNGSFFNSERMMSEYVVRAYFR